MQYPQHNSESADKRTTTTKIVKETEAEAVAFVVGEAIGLEMASASVDYIALYRGNVTLLAESHEIVQQAAWVILSALDNSFDRAVNNLPPPATETRDDTMTEVA
jgi:hypothetical protein